MRPIRTQLPTPDYYEIFEKTPGMCVVLTTDFVVVAATDLYLQTSMTERAQLIGRYLFDVFPDNPDDPDASGVSRVTESLQTVLRTKQSHTMAVVKYDVRRPESEGGGFEERYWIPVNAPILDAAGDITLLIHRVDDVTARVRLEQERDAVVRSLQTALDDLRTVRGLIPICAWCRKLRDEHGSWQQLEAFFSDRGDASFTHSVCAECASTIKA